MKRKPILPVLVWTTLAVVLAVGLFMANSSSSFARSAAAAHGPTKLHVVERATNEHIIDIGPTGDSIGDLDTFYNPVYDAANKKLVGHDSGNCVRTVVGKTYECNWTFFFKDGYISVEGPSYDKSDSMLAIIGGTGYYKGVRGEMKMHPRGTPLGSEFEYTLYRI